MLTGTQEKQFDQDLKTKKGENLTGLARGEQNMELSANVGSSNEKC